MYHRSGIAIIKSERKRHEKIGGSIKCRKTCPAFMTSIREQQQEAIKITVEYQSVHAGHEMEVDKLNPLTGYLPPEKLFRKRFTLILPFPSKMQQTSILSPF
ncbi:hypothetical protein TNCV_1890311 [Trichonephila clavipes]|nr:hypothetical protein TNCV_1890311 [Trichonephila clavipes]